MTDGPGPPAGNDAPLLHGASPRTYLALFGHRGFRVLMGSSLLATLGDWVGFLAIIALTHDLLGPTRAAAFAVSGVMAARVVPSLLLAPIAGVFVDRWDRKRVLVVTHLARAAVMALIPFTDEILTLLLATLVLEVMAALFAPAKDAIFPTLVRRDQLVHANQVNLIVTYGTLPVAGVLFATLIGLAGALAPAGSFVAGRPVALAIWFNAVAFLLSAPLLALLPLTAQVRSPQRIDPVEIPGAWAQLKEGLAFVSTHPVIRALIVGVMVASAAAGVVITAGEFFARLLNAGPSGYGILVAAVGAGMVLGLVLSGPLTSRIQPERLFAPAIGSAGLALAATALMPSLLLASGPALLMGAGAGVVFIVGYTVLQQRADDAIRGRTFGAFNSGVRTAIFGSTIAVPAAIGLLGREAPVLGTGADGAPRLVYPYAIGGVRITLLIAGLLAVVGALVVAGSLRRALAREREHGLALAAPAPAPSPRGLFVVFEGGDGSGKSTQIRLLRTAVERTGLPVVVTREPGGTPIGEQVRELLLAPGSAAMGDRAEALLYAAARAQHVAEVIGPALDRGAVVLCDRFVDSSIVYQGAGRGLGEPQVEELNRWATGGLAPDLVVLLDLAPGEGLRRAAEGGVPDRLESAGSAFHADVHAAYRRRAAADPDRYLVLDGTLPVEVLQERIRQAVYPRLQIPEPRPTDAPVPAREPGS